MFSRFIACAAFSLALIPAHSLDVSGTVFDKVFRPLPGAQVCLQAEPGTCVTSGSDGSFHIKSGVTAIAWAQPGRGSAQGIRRQASAPGAGLEWFTGDGRRMAGGHAALAWKAAVPGGNPGSRTPGADREAAGSAFGSALAKAAAGSGLSVTKTGYAEAVHQPLSDTETGALIVLGGVGEKVSLLFNGKNLDGWLPSSGKTLGGATGSWTVKDGALHSEGTVRGVLVPKEDYGDYRVVFSVRHLKTDAGKADHYPCFLFWGMSRDALPNDALGALQFEPPTTYAWDYRPGHNNAGTFTKVGAKTDEYQWSRCEVFANAAASEARLACCTETAAGPCKTAELIKWKEAGWAKKGPWGFQVHNTGIHDEYRNIAIETDPVVRDLITNK